MTSITKLLRKQVTMVAVSILMGLLVGAIVLAIAGYSPVAAYQALLKGVFSRPRYLVQVMIRSTPLILTGISIAFAFRTGLFNIGAEGQYIIGSTAALLVGRFIPLPKGIHFFACILVGMLAAAVWGAFSGYLKSKYGIHEVITCIMLNWIALYLNNFLVNRPWLKQPGTEASFEALPTSWSMVLGEWKSSEEGLAYLAQHKELRDVLLRTDLNYGIVIAIFAAVVIWFLLNRTVLGFELRAVGFNKDAAEFSGINVKQRMVQAMAISGALAGLAGALTITGTGLHRINIIAMHEGFGFDGISVALIAGSAPLGCILSGLLFGALKYGSSAIQSTIKAPSEIINIVIGVIVFCVALSSMFPMLAEKLESRKQRQKPPQKEKGGDAQ